MLINTIAYVVLWNSKPHDPGVVSAQTCKLCRQEKLVKDYMLSKFDKGLAAHPEWTDQLNKCKHLFQTCSMPDNDDIEFASSFFQLQLMVSFNGEPVHHVGSASWPKVMLSNLPVVDGAKKSQPHFRYIWAEDEPLSKKESVDEALGFNSPVTWELFELHHVTKV